MIALDANTALRPYREAQYDLKEILTGLGVLAGDDPAVHLFRYADGSTAPAAPAALVQSLVTSFPCLSFLGAVGLYAAGDSAIVAPVSAEAQQLRQQIDIALQGAPTADMVQALRNALRQLGAGLAARVDSTTMEYVGEGPVPIRQSSIGRLTVTGTMVMDDASQLLGKGKAGRLTSSTVLVTGDAKAPSVRVGHYRPSLVGTQRMGDVSVQSLHYPSLGGSSYQAQRVSRPNTVEATASMPGVHIAEEIVLTGPNAQVVIPVLGARMLGHVDFTYHIPYATEGTVQYLPVASVGATLQGERQLLDVPGLWALLLWPMWRLTASTSLVGNAVTYATSYTAMVPDVEGYPAVRVTNGTPSDIRKVPHVWQFGKRPDGSGTVTVISTVLDIPALSSIDFFFAYDRASNVACMYPTRTLLNA